MAAKGYGYGSKKESAKKVSETPDYFQAADTAEGFEEITTQTMAIPFIRVLQTLSPQLNKKKPEYIPGAQEGMFFNTVTKEIYGPVLDVIVLKFDRIFIEWLPERGGLVNYHSPEHAEEKAVNKEVFGGWKTKSGNTLQENYVYFVLLDGRMQEGIAILSLASTQIKIAREWNRLMTTHIMENGRRALPFYLVWTLETEYRENDKGNWYTFKVRTKKYITREQYEKVGTERKLLPARQVDYAQLNSSEDVEPEEDTPF